MVFSDLWWTKVFLVVFNDPFLVMPRYRYVPTLQLSRVLKKKFIPKWLFVFLPTKRLIQRRVTHLNFSFQRPFQPYEILVSNSRSHGHHHGELLAAWWWVRDISALNLSLVGGFMNKIKSVNTSFGAARGGKTQVERLDVTYLSPAC